MFLLRNWNGQLRGCGSLQEIKKNGCACRETVFAPSGAGLLCLYGNKFLFFAISIS